MDPEPFAYRVTAIYLRDRLTREAMLDYAEEFHSLGRKLEIVSIPNGQPKVGIRARPQRSRSEAWVGALVCLY